MAGAESGRVTFSAVCKVEAPETREASSREASID
jgi:hypothetical protein